MYYFVTFCFALLANLVLLNENLSIQPLSNEVTSLWVSSATTMPRVLKVALADCPETTVIHQEDLPLPFFHHYQGSIDFNTVNTHRTVGMYFLVSTGNRGDIE